MHVATACTSDASARAALPGLDTAGLPRQRGTSLLLAIVARAAELNVHLANSTLRRRMRDFHASRDRSACDVGLAFHPRERMLAAGGDADGVVRLWSLEPELDAVGRGALVGPGGPIEDLERILGIHSRGRSRVPRRIVLV